MRSPNLPAIAARILQPRSWLPALWAGRGAPAIRWRALASAVIAALLASSVYTVALAGLRWAMPLKLIGWICLLLSAIAVIWCLRTTLTVILQLGVKRLLLLLLILYIGLVLIVGMLTPDGGSGLGHWGAIAVEVMAWPIRALGGAARTAVDAPDAVGFAAAGHRSPIKIPGIDWTGGVPPTPIVITDGTANTEDTTVEEAPTPIPPSSVRPLRVGDTVQVIGTQGAALRARTEPSASAQIVARFPAGSLLYIMDGPQVADGHTWWKVKSDQDEGWCAADFLAPANEQ